MYLLNIALIHLLSPEQRVSVSTGLIFLLAFRRQLLSLIYYSSTAAVNISPTLSKSVSREAGPADYVRLSYFLCPEAVCHMLL